MIKNKKILILVLAFPILCLIILTGYKKYILSFGQEVVLPISGYDPRDLLSGHYLIYNIEYGVENICYESNHAEAYICLEPKNFSYSRPENCQKLIRGNCSYSRFVAGIEKFYIPQEYAAKLENEVQSKSASIVLSITRDGSVQIKDLLIDGQPWKNQIK